MAMHKGRRHEVTLDGQTVWLDSMNEEIALRRFIEQYGFGGKWERPQYGIKHANRYYSPDFELAINDYSNTSRALVEVKQYRRDFTKDMAGRMCAVAHHYHTDCLLLYAVKTDKWYRVIPGSGIVRDCTPPQPGALDLSELAQPARFVTTNYYGRKYYQSWIDTFTSMFFPAPPPKRRKRRKRKTDLRNNP